MDKLTASKLRQDIYRVLDQVIDTGVPVQIERRGETLEIVLKRGPSKLERLVERPYLAADPDDIVHLDWSSEWRP